MSIIIPIERHQLEHARVQRHACVATIHRCCRYRIHSGLNRGIRLRGLGLRPSPDEDHAANRVALLHVFDEQEGSETFATSSSR